MRIIFLTTSLKLPKSAIEPWEGKVEKLNQTSAILQNMDWIFYNYRRGLQIQNKSRRTCEACQGRKMDTHCRNVAI